MRLIVATAVVLVAGNCAALAAQPPDPMTVNDYTAAQKAAALSAARAAGYTDGTVTMFQAGNFFVRAARSGQIYELTVRPDGKVFASTPLPQQTG